MKMDTKKPYPMACKSMIVSFTVWLHFVMQVDNNILHHMATFHLDKIDLSKLMLDNGNNIDLLESVHARMGSAFLDGGISRFFQGICVQAAHSYPVDKFMVILGKTSIKIELQVIEQG